jgi:hypothetical protein
MDLGPESKAVCVGKSAQAFTQAGGKVGKTADSGDLCFQENLLGRSYVHSYRNPTQVDG